MIEVLDKIVAALIGFVRGHAGTVARGLLWALGLLLQLLGSHGITPDAAAVQGIQDSLPAWGSVLTGTVCELIALGWSHLKNGKLLKTPPPAADPRGSRTGMGDHGDTDGL